MTRKIRFIFLFNFFLLSLFSQNGQTYYTDTVRLSEKGLPLDTNVLYFPTYIFYDNYDYLMYDNTSAADKVKYKNKHAFYANQRYSEALFMFEEPVLYSRPQTNDILRIMVLPSFSQPYCITMNLKNDSVSLTLKTLSGKGGYWYGKPLGEISKKISRNSVDSILNQFTTSQAVKLNTIDDKPSDFTDGSSYIVEYIPKGKYYLYYRHVTIDKSIMAIIQWTFKATNVHMETGR